MQVQEQIKQLEKDKGGYCKIVQQVQELKRLRDMKERGGSSPRNVVRDNRNMMHDYQVSKLANMSYMSTRNREIRTEASERH